MVVHVLVVEPCDPGADQELSLLHLLESQKSSGLRIASLEKDPNSTFEVFYQMHTTFMSS